MVLLLLVCSVLVKLTSAEYGISGLPYQDHQGYASAYHDYKPHDYQFSYGVSDPHTGDHKTQWEVKEKGVVRGGYSLLEPDGTTRIVEYIADDDGFRAVVKKLGTSIHPTHGHVDAHSFSHANQGQQQAAPEGLTYKSYPQEHSEKIIVENPEYDHDDEDLNEKPQLEYEQANLENEEHEEEEEHEREQHVQPNYKSYSGDIDNYSNVLSAAVAHLKPEEYPKPIEIPHTVELHGYQNLAHVNEIASQYHQHYQHPQVQPQVDYPRAPGLNQGGNPSHNYYYQNSNYDPFTQDEKNFIEPTASIEYPVPEAQNHYPSYSYFGQTNGPRYARSFSSLRKMEISGNQAKPMVMSYSVSHH